MPEQAKPLTPPYISFATFKSTLRTLGKAGHLPDRIDNSVLGTMGGSIKLQFVSAMRFLNLIDDNKHPLPAARTMATANDAEWQKVLTTLLNEHYGEQIKFLAAGSPQQLREAFGNEFPSIVTPAIRFLVSAAKDAGLAVAEHHKTVKGRAGTSGSRKKKKTPELEQPERQDKPVGQVHSADEKHDGMMTFPIHLPGRKQGKIVVPDDIDEDEVGLVEAQIAYLKLYAKRIKAAKEVS